MRNVPCPFLEQSITQVRHTRVQDQYKDDGYPKMCSLDIDTLTISLWMYRHKNVDSQSAEIEQEFADNERDECEILNADQYKMLTVKELKLTEKMLTNKVLQLKCPSRGLISGFDRMHSHDIHLDKVHFKEYTSLLFVSAYGLHPLEITTLKSHERAKMKHRNVAKSTGRRHACSHLHTQLTSLPPHHRPGMLRHPVSGETVSDDAHGRSACPRRGHSLPWATSSRPHS